MPDYAVSTAFTAKDRVTRAFEAMGRGADKFGGKASAAFNKASRSGSRFGDIVKGILAADIIKQGVGLLKRGLETAFKGVIGEASNLESAVADFKTLTGSIEAATSVVNELNAAAAATPFEFGDLSKATKTLMGFEATTRAELIPTLKMLGDTAGGSADRFDGIVLAFSQIQAQGKASMQDINQLINNGVPILGQLAKQWGVTIGQAREMTSKGRATGEEVTKAFKAMTQEGGKFYKGMETASLTFSGRTSTLIDNVKLAGASIGTALLPQLKAGQDLLISVAEKVKAWADANQEIIKARFDGFINGLRTAWNTATGLYQVMEPFLHLIPYLVGWFVAYNGVLKALAIGQAVASFIKFVVIARQMAGVMGVLNAVMAANPIGMVILAVTGLIVGLIYLEKRFGLLSKGWEMLKIGFTKAVEAMKTVFMKFASFYINLWAKIIGTVLAGASKLGGMLGIDTSGLDALAARVEKFRAEVDAAANGAEAPNAKEAEARKIQFMGQLNIAGAPAGSTVESKTTGAPPLRLELMGVNP